MEDIRAIIGQVDIERLSELLARHPELSNQGIGLRENERAVAHPLHRLCDGVHAGLYSDDDAIRMAQVFLAFGADINGGTLRTNRDSPLTAAASLSAEKTAMYYIDKGALITHPGCYGGTALHWAAWCGRDLLVAKLIAASAPLEERCSEFLSTPLFWAVHGFTSGGARNRRHQFECARLLIAAGANKDTRNKDGVHILDLLNDSNAGLRALLT